MDDELRAIASQFGVFLTREALAAGHDNWSVLRQVRARAWVRVRHGAYTFPEMWSALDDRGRHRLRARAAYRTSRTDVAISHTSRIADLTDRLWGLSLDDVHLTRLDGRAGRREAGLCPHRGRVVASDIEVVNGYLSLSAARSSIDLAAIVGPEATLVAWDGLLASGALTVGAIEACYHDGLSGNPYMLHVPRLFSLTAPTGSVGETRFLYLCHTQGLPRPSIQEPVRDPLTGTLLGTTDFWWGDYHTYGEFDGLVKLTRHLRPGETPTQAVAREKKREDEIRGATGAKFIRYVWSDLDDPVRTRERTWNVLRAPYFRVTIPLSG